MLPRERRLTTREFQDVYQRGSVVPGRFVVLRVLRTEHGPGRWGFAVGQKLVRDAPSRAKWRRRLRAVVSSMTYGLDDYVLTMRSAGLRASLPQLHDEIAKLLDEMPPPSGKTV